ncbi:MAG: iron-sulfur cluster assembly scaffold protein [Nitrosopumilaceae archaeon]|nr:iron-sulfur cluster assembly scaffold protein [Nitrosopumilaceae archaeon]
MMSNSNIYHEMIIDYSRNPINFGTLVKPDIFMHDSNPLCGDSIDLYMNVNNEQSISEVKFNGKGCAICIACTSVLTEMTKGKKIDDVIKINKTDVLSELGLQKLNPVRIKCALLSLKILKFSIYSYLSDKMKTEDTKSEKLVKLKEDASHLY